MAVSKAEIDSRYMKSGLTAWMLELQQVLVLKRGRGHIKNPQIIPKLYGLAKYGPLDF
jgi:hypothetical protein